MLYAAKCYWPGVTPRELEALGARARRAAHQASPSPRPAAYVGSILFPDDDLVLCLFEASSQAAVRRASEDAGIPCERVMSSRWFEPLDP
jgi:hypothetical protein